MVIFWQHLLQKMQHFEQKMRHFEQKMPKLIIVSRLKNQRFITTDTVLVFFLLPHGILAPSIFEWRLEGQNGLKNWNHK